MRGAPIGARPAHLSGPGLAQALRCDGRLATGTRRGGNWLPAVPVLHHAPSRGRVVVFGPVIRLFVGKPIDGRRDRETGARRSLSRRFDARVPGDERRSAAMFCRLNRQADGRRARIGATPSGFDNARESAGTCTLSPGGRAPTAARP